MLSCRKAIRCWSESLDHKIPTWSRVLLTTHLIGCGACSRYRKQVTAIRECHRIMAEQIPEGDKNVMLSVERAGEIIAAMKAANGENPSDRL